MTQPVIKTVYTTTTKAKRKRDHKKEYRKEKHKRIYARVEAGFQNTPHLLVFYDENKLIIKSSHHWDQERLYKVLPECLSASSLNSENVMGRDDIKISAPEMKLTEDDIRVMSNDSMRKTLSSIVTKGRLKTAPRTLWGNPDVQEELGWWPEHIPFVPPKAVINHKYVHSAHTLQQCLMSYVRYNDSKEHGSTQSDGVDFDRASTDIENTDQTIKGSPNSTGATDDLTSVIDHPYSAYRPACKSNEEGDAEKMDTDEPERSVIDLTSEVDNKIDATTRRITNKNGVDIYETDIHSLDEGKWLTSNVIDASLRRTFHAERASMTVHWSHWVTEKSKGLRDLRNGLHLFPTCMESHWWLLVAEVKNRTLLVHHVDSLNANAKHRYYKAGLLLESYLGWKRGTKYYIVAVPQQKNGDDCGVHTIHNGWRVKQVGWRALHELKTHGNIATTREAIKEYLLQHNF